MITLVADSNALRDPFLRTYLARGADHVVALSDLALVEMRKTRALATSRESLRIASEFPSQVLVLRRTDDLLSERIASAEDAGRIVDADASMELARLARDLQANPRPEGLVERMLRLEADAKIVFSRLVEEVASFEPTLFEVLRDFSRAEVTQLRTGAEVADATRGKLLDLLKETIGLFILRNQEPGRRAPMRLGEAMTMFAGRYSLCMLLFYVEWVRTGRTTKRLDRRVNDIVDMQTVAVATYFNGVLSADAALQRVSFAVRRILRGYGAFVGRDWTVGEGQPTCERAGL